MYNFEVEDFHTYYVGDSGVLVHNMCNTSKIGKQICNAPRSNQAQNKQFDSIIKSLKLNKQQARMLHDIITGQGYSRDEIMDIAIDLFGKRRWR